MAIWWRMALAIFLLTGCIKNYSADDINSMSDAEIKQACAKAYEKEKSIKENMDMCRLKKQYLSIQLCKEQKQKEIEKHQKNYETLNCKNR